MNSNGTELEEVIHTYLTYLICDDPLSRALLRYRNRSEVSVRM